MKQRIIIFISFLVGATSCFNTAMDDDYTYINPKIKPYVDNFINEAHIRDVSIDIQYLKIDFVKISDAAGRTYYDNKIILIDSTSIDWNIRPEELVFHELGHLFLHRSHDNTLINNKIVKSIMNNNDAASYEYGPNNFKRKYYIDELFNPNTPKPNWVN